MQQMKVTLPSNAQQCPMQMCEGTHGRTSRGGDAKAGRLRFGFRSGFTLIELLVVIAIIALLIGILIPALGKARSTARQLKCLTNTRGMGTAFTLYANDFKSVFPVISSTSVAANAPFESQSNRGGLSGLFSLNQIGSKNGDGVNESDGQIKRWEGVPGAEGDTDPLERYANGNRKPLMRDYLSTLETLVCPSDKEDYYWGQAQTGGGTPFPNVTDQSGMIARRRTPRPPSAEREVVGTNISYLYISGLKTDEPKIPYPPPLFGDETSGKDVNTSAWYGANVQNDGSVTYDIPSGLQSFIQVGKSGYASIDNHGTSGANFVFADGHGAFLIDNVQREFFASISPEYSAQKSINVVDPNRTFRVETID